LQGGPFQITKRGRNLPKRVQKDGIAEKGKKRGEKVKKEAIAP